MRIRWPAISPPSTAKTSPKIGNDVTEGFVEVALPLLVDKPLVKSLNFNGAARLSDYSTSGQIWSWKLGGTWHMVDDFKLRATRSRDIRAAESHRAVLGARPRSSRKSRIFRRRPANQRRVILFTGGNPQLDPEIADTLTVGAVFSPSFVPGLEVSLDYYHIKIEDVISTLAAQEIVNSCYDQGNQSAVQPDHPRRQPVPFPRSTRRISTSPSSPTRAMTSRRPIKMPLGRRSTRPCAALVNYVDSLAVDNGIATIEGAGYLGSQTGFLVPQWRGTLSFGYESELVRRRPSRPLSRRRRLCASGSAAHHQQSHRQPHLHRSGSAHLYPDG